MTYTYIYKENYSEKIYESYHNFIDKKVDAILEDLRKSDPKNDFNVFKYDYETWVEDTLDEAIEATRYSIECDNLANEIFEDLIIDFQMLEDEIEWHNERAIELQ